MLDIFKGAIGNSQVGGAMRAIILAGAVAASNKGWLPGGYDYSAAFDAASLFAVTMWSIFAKRNDAVK